MRRRRGQLLVPALLLLLVLAIIIPIMVFYVQNEARWSAKQGQNTNAFQLAEAAVERGYQKVTESTTTWAAIQAGQTLAGFNLDTPYNDLGSGSYAVSITKGSDPQTVAIIGIGRDSNLKEVRALEVVYVNSLVDGSVGIIAAGGVAMSGANVNVEWGSIVSPKTISIGSKKHPYYWSASSIDLDANGPTPPNCDQPNCWWWRSYDSQIPPMPSIDFGAYQSSAAASLTDSCGNSYYRDGSYDKHTFNNCTDTGGHTYYVTGNWDDFKSAVAGNIIVLGNLNFANGGQATLPAYNAQIPSTAWRQYCNDWATYKSNYDPGTPYSSCPSPSSGYAPASLTKSIDPAIHGLVYVGGDLTIPNGGGNSDLIHGVFIVQGAADINANSHAHVYYDSLIAANIQTTVILLTRQSWKDVVRQWPFSP